MYLPKEVTVLINSRGKAFRYGFLLIGIYIVCSFAFSNYFPYGTAIGIGTIVLGISLIIFMAKRDRSTKSRYILSEEGIREFKNGQETFILWAEPHQTYYDATTFTGIGLPLATVSKTQVVTPNKKITVNYPNTTFHNTLITLSTNYLLPQLIAKLKQGKSLYFGPVELNDKTIIIQKKEYALEEISSVSTENGYLKLKLKSEWFSTKLAVNEIPDFMCLTTILRDRIQIV